MNTLIKYAVAIVFFVTVSLLGVDSASGAKPTRVTVTLVTPDSASQGDTPVVRIKGTGFDNRSTVKFLVTGTNDDTQVEITGPAELIDGDLVVPIYVLDTAIVDFYDVEVRTSSGRRGKGTDLFSVKLSGGGNVYPTFDVTFGGDLVGDGTFWQSDQKQEGLTYWLSDQQGGTGDIGLTYFEDQFPIWSDCFDETAPINGVQFWRDKNGMAILKMSFMGRSQDRSMDFMYHLTLNGYFDSPGDWLPQVSTTVTMTNWKLKLKSKRENNLYRNISCVGEGAFATANIRVDRN